MPDYLDLNTPVVDKKGRRGIVAANITDGGPWIAFVQWDDGEYESMRYEDIRPEGESE